MLMSSVLSVFIHNIGGDKLDVGLAATASGIAATAVIFPAGILADRWRRDRLIWLGNIILLGGVALLCLAEDMTAIYVAEALMGISGGIGGVAVEALLADSTKTGQRTGVYVYRHVISSIGWSVGPFLNVALFWSLGDNWDTSTLRIVIGAGGLVILLGTCVSLYQNDKFSLAEDESSTNDDSVALGKEDTTNALSSHFGIPLVLVGLSVIIGFGAGMTVMFFPLFFKEIYHLTPIQVNTIVGFTNLFTAFAGLIAQRISRSIGRVETMFIVQLVATVALFWISFYPILLILIPLFIFRNGFMNSSFPLQRTIVMDHIAKRHRGRWNALEAVAFGLFWPISAAVGGWLLDSYDYSVVFLITVCLYTTGTLPLLAIRKHVPHEQTDDSTNDEQPAK